MNETKSIECSDKTMESFFPTNKSELNINTALHVAMPRPKPNWWWRMWQYLLLGWKWREL